MRLYFKNIFKKKSLFVNVTGLLLMAQNWEIVANDQKVSSMALHWAVESKRMPAIIIIIYRWYLISSFKALSYGRNVPKFHNYYRG